MDFKRSGESVIYTDDLRRFHEIADAIRQKEPRDKPSAKPPFRLPVFGNTQKSQTLDVETTKAIVDLAGQEVRKKVASYENHLFAIGICNSYSRAIRAERYRRSS